MVSPEDERRDLAAKLVELDKSFSSEGEVGVESKSEIENNIENVEVPVDEKLEFVDLEERNSVNLSDLMSEDGDEPRADDVILGAIETIDDSLQSDASDGKKNILEDSETTDKTEFRTITNLPSDESNSLINSSISTLPVEEPNKELLLTSEESEVESDTSIPIHINENKQSALLDFELPQSSRFLFKKSEDESGILACAMTGSFQTLITIQSKLVDAASIVFIKQNNIRSDFESLKLYFSRFDWFLL